MTQDPAPRTDLCGRPWWGALALLALLAAPLPARAMPCTDMTLVLAIDGSGSISDAEFALQLGATARAITDPQVVAAMGALGGVAVTAVIWGDTAFGLQSLDWVHVRDAPSAAQFAAMLAAQPRTVSGNTDLGHGLNAALDRIDDPRNCASYNVIDVSGDGRETTYARRRGISLAVARARAQAMGVVVNGLAVSALDGQLVDYYRNHVITGPAAFVIEAPSFAAFGQAMQRKLLAEVQGFGVMQLASAGPPPDPAPVRAGETARQRW